MVIVRHSDGSEGYYFEYGDLVVITEDDHYSCFPSFKENDWGRITNSDKTRHPAIGRHFVWMAGVSKPKDSFLRGHTVPAWDLYPCIDTYKNAVVLEAHPRHHN